VVDEPWATPRGGTWSFPRRLTSDKRG